MGARRYVAVIGPAEATPVECDIAHEVGRLVAAGGAVVVTGGMGGVMAAAAAGCSAADGTSLGLLPGTERHGNSTIEVPTGLGELRNALVVRAADAVIAVGGSWGTLSEIALARRTGVPVVCIAGWSIIDDTGAPVDVVVATSAADAVSAVLD